MRKLTHTEIVNRQNLKRSALRLPCVVVLNNIRSAYNVGSIFRTADGVGVEKIWLCGITGTPANPQVAKTALGAENTIPWEHHPSATIVAQQLRKQGYKIVLLEQTEQSISYDEFEPDFPLCLILGNEVEGVNDSVLPYCDHAIEIDMMGLKNSLNVSVAFGIIAYHLSTNFKHHLARRS